MRRALTEYLQRRRSDRIAASYRRAYARDAGLGDEHAGWTDEGEWPGE